MRFTFSLGNQNRSFSTDKPFGLLAAPLEDYSDRAFRAICYHFGATKTVLGPMIE